MKMKRGIGIEVRSSHLCAVQILRIGRAFCIERVLNKKIRRSTDSPSAILKTLASKYGFNRRASVAISVPKESVFFRSIETEAAGRDHLRASGPFPSEYDFPIEPDETVTQYYSHRQMTDGKCSVLTAAVAKESLRDTFDILRGAKMRPDLIDTTIFAIQSSIALNHPESRRGVAIIAHIAESHLTLAVTQDNNVLMVRSFPVFDSSDDDSDTDRQSVAEVLITEAEIIWQKLFEDEIEQGTRCYLVTGDGNAADLKAAIEENLHCQTIIVNPYAKVLLKHLHRASTDIIVAEGLALRLLVPDRTKGVNFLESDNANLGRVFNVKKEFAIYAVLIAAIAVISLAGLFVRLGHLENRYAQVKNEMKDIFQRTLPEEKNIVNPMAQIEQKVQSLRKDYALLSSLSGTDTAPLEVLHAIATSIPEELHIGLKDILVTAESVRLTGTSQSFESVYDWQRLLRDTLLFSIVDVSDVRREPKDEMVHFVVSASLAAEKQT